MKEPERIIEEAIKLIQALNTRVLRLEQSANIPIPNQEYEENLWENAEQTIALADIQNAVDLLNADKTPDIKKETEFGWIKTDNAGVIMEIGLNKKTQGLVNNLLNEADERTGLKNGKLTTLFGVPIFEIEEETMKTELSTDNGATWKTLARKMAEEMPMPKQKRMPLLILGKRQSGKSTALVKFAKYLPEVIGVAHSPHVIKYLSELSGKEVEFISSYDVPSKEVGYSGEWVIDEFSRCEKLPEGQIIALTDDTDNFLRVLKRLKGLGYPVSVCGLDKQKVKEVLKMNQEFITWLADKKKIESYPKLNELRTKIEELKID